VNRTAARLVLGASVAGPALCQLAVRYWGRRGTALVACVCTGLAARDLAMVADGVPSRLCRGPATLLYLELLAALAAAGLNWRAVLHGAEVARGLSGPDTGARGAAPDPFEVARRGAVAALFGLHTARFRIYLGPDQGRRQAPAS